LSLDLVHSYYKRINIFNDWYRIPACPYQPNHGSFNNSFAVALVSGSYFNIASRNDVNFPISSAPILGFCASISSVKDALRRSLIFFSRPKHQQILMRDKPSPSKKSSLFGTRARRSRGKSPSTSIICANRSSSSDHVFPAFGRNRSLPKTN